MEGDIDSVHSALEGGVSANAASADSTTALQWATQDNYTDIVRLLIANEADANVSNRYGFRIGVIW